MTRGKAPGTPPAAPHAGGVESGAGSSARADEVSLARAFALGPKELVSFVGGGGKTSAIQMLARELSGRGPVVITTTTAMLLSELTAMGPVTIKGRRSALVAQVWAVLRRTPVAAAGLRRGEENKVIGLPPSWVDTLWARSVAPYLLVEADGSRGLPLKAFGPHEPQLPGATTTIVQMAGLDVIGAPLTDEHVHRAEELAAALGLHVGSPVSTEVFVLCLRRQLLVLRRGAPGARIITFLNKAETTDRQAAARMAAEQLLARPGQPAVTATERAPTLPQPPATAEAEARPDCVVIGSLHRRTFARVPGRPLVAAIVLAAGRSTRMGGQKVLLPVAGRPLVQRVVDAALGSTAAETIVVVGHEAARVREALRERPVTMVANPDPDRGMSSSLRAGIEAVQPNCEAAVFLLGDQPFVTAGLVDRLISGFAETGKWVVRPLVRGRPANPVLMSTALFPEIMEQRGDVGGREIARLHADRICSVPVDEVALALDVDTREDYRVAIRIVEEITTDGQET